MLNEKRRARRRGVAVLSLAACAVVAIPKRADAGTKFWKIGTSGNWATAGNWSTASAGGSDSGGVPGAGDTVTIVTTDTATRTVTYNYTGAAITLNSLTIDQTGGSTFDVLSMTSANALTGDETIGLSGRGSMVQTSGVTVVGGQLFLGKNLGSTGAYALSSASSSTSLQAYLVATGGETIGGAGAGTFTQGGSNNVFNEPTDFLALNNANSLYTLSHGFLYLTGTGSTQAELLNAGTFNQTGGDNFMGSAPINYTLQMGSVAAQGATYNLSGGQGYVSGDAYIGGSTTASKGTGILNISGSGTMTVTGALKIWNNASAVNLSGSGVLSVGSLVTGGGTIANQFVAGWTGGTLAITGSSGLALGTETVGNPRPLGTTLTLDATHALSVSNTFTLDSNASLTLSAGTLTAGSIVNNGGEFTWNGGTIAVTGDSGVTLGGNAPFGSTVTVDSGHTLNVTNALTLPNGSLLSLSTGGALTVGSIVNTGGNFIWGAGSLSVTGAAGVTLGGASPFGSTVTVDIGHPLTVTNTLTIPTGSTLDLQTGGTLTVGALSNQGTLNWSSATLAITGQGTHLTTLDLGTASGQTLNQTGGSIATGNLTVGTTTGHSGTLALNGAGVVFTDGGDAYVGGNALGTGGTGTVSVQSGSTLTIAGKLKIYNNGGSILNLAPGGSLSAGSLDTDSNTAGFDWTGGTLSITGGAGGTGLGLGVLSSSRPLGSTLTLTSTRTLNVTSALTIDSGASFTLTSGALSVGSIDNHNVSGGFTWAGGSLTVTGSSGVTLGSGAPFGTTFTADSTHPLSVTNALTIPLNDILNLSSGILSAGSIVNNGTFNWTTGTFAQTGSGAFPLASATIPSTGSYILSPLNSNIAVTPPVGAVNNTLINSSGQFILTSPNAPYDVTFAGNITNNATIRVRGGAGGARVIAGAVDNFGAIVFNQQTADGMPLTMNALTMESGSSVWTNLGPPGVADTINVTTSGSLTFTANPIQINLFTANNIVSPSTSVATYTVGDYPLFHYNGTFNGTPSFTNGAGGVGFSSAFSFSYITDATNGNIDLDIVPSGGSTWNGASSANWSGSNWGGGSVPIASQFAVFPTPVPGGFGSTITVPGGATSNGVQFNDNYTLTGGSLALTNGLVNVLGSKTVTIGTNLNAVSTYGSLGLLKTGAGTLVLTGANTYTGTTVVNSGTLRAGASNTFPAVTTLQASSGTIDTGGTGAFNQTVRTVILSSGSINVNSGTLTATNGVMVNAAAGAGFINLGGGTLSTPSYQTNSNHTSLNWTAGTLQLTGTGAVPVTTVPLGSTLALNAANSNIVVTGLSLGTSGPAKPPTIPIPSPTTSFLSSRSGATIDTITIHTTEESYAATINGFETGTDSANYVNDTDGTITEVLDGSNPKAAAHATYYNDRAIGIENVGFADQAGTWNPKNIASLEKLVAYLAYTYNVPVLQPTDNLQANILQVQRSVGATLNEPGIMGHGQIQPNDRYDPGYYFPWAQFIGDVQTLIANSINAAPLTNNGTLNVTNAGGFGITYRGDIINVGNMNVTGTNLTVSGNITSSGSITLAGGGLSAVSTTLNSGGVAHLNSGIASLGSLVLNGTGAANVASGSGMVVHAQQVTANGTGSIDLADAKMDITAQPLGVGSWNGSNYTGVQGLVRSGRNGGAWNGKGIITSKTAAQGAAPLTTLAVATAGDVGKITFGGQPVASTDVLVMYTYAGDANLTGSITGDDYAQIDAGFAAQSPTLSGYTNGDFNYDGKINADDYFLIDKNYARQSTPFSAGATLDAGTALAGVSAVPEPGCIGLLMAGALGLRRRKR